MSDQLLRVDEVAQRLAVKQSTIRRMILERKIGYVKLGRAVRIPAHIVELKIKEGWRAPVLPIP